MSYYNKKKDQVLLEQQFAFLVVKNYNKYDPIFSLILNLPDCPYSEINRETFKGTSFSKKIFYEDEEIFKTPTKTLKEVLLEEETLKDEIER